jgi:hypothetical protein
MLSRIAEEFAREIRNHDWSDSPYRADRAGHRREHDGHRSSSAVLSPAETGIVVTNVMWVTAQVLMHADPNFDLVAYAEACGVPRRMIYNSNNQLSGILTSGIRYDVEGRASAHAEEGSAK